jgi:hypothetical protein
MKPQTLTEPELFIQKALRGCDGASNDHLLPQIRNYLIHKFFTFAESEDPAISLKGVEMLARTNMVGLFKERVEVSFTDKTNEELEMQLQEMMAKLAIDSVAR